MKAQFLNHALIIVQTEENKVVQDQAAQIAALSAQVKQLDALSQDSVYADPVRKVQEQLYQ